MVMRRRADSSPSFGLGLSPHSNLGAEARGYDRRARVWALRMLVKAGGYKRVPQLLNEEAIYETLELTPSGKAGKRFPFNAVGFLKQARTRMKSLEKKPDAEDGVLGRNLALLGELTGLNEVEKEIFAFATLMEYVPWLQGAAEAVGEVDTHQAGHLISLALDVPLEAVLKAIHPFGVLHAAGLLRLVHAAVTFPNKVEVLDTVGELLLTEGIGADELLGAFFRQAPEPTLDLGDFEHVGCMKGLIHRHLQASIEQRAQGANVLVYGAPGTGKTEFVRALATALDCRLYEISAVTGDGDPAPPTSRIRAYQLSQHILKSSRKTLVMFDEIEDVFTNHLFALDGASGPPGKAWVNQLLESNAVPAIWVSNNSSVLDPAYVRRFDLVLEMPAQPRSARQKLLESVFQGVELPRTALERLARVPQLTPAAIARAGKVLRNCADASPEVNEEAALAVISGTLAAMGEGPVCTSRREEPQLPYSLDYISCDHDLGAVLEGLRGDLGVRMCLYGPPGTGKTAFGRHVADTLGRPLIARRASDLLSCFVGGTEERIAEMFAEARRDGAVLLLDEADSFFRERVHARQAWEVTQVNEFLTQAESFEGVFIASTNLMEDLDQASLRRFDLKMRFDYLRLEQAVRLSRAVLSAAGEGDGVDGLLRARLSALPCLAPGDFAVAVRRARILGQQLDAAWLVEMLEAEHARKADARRPFLGFAPVSA